jgi:hypothetical protein
VVKDGAPPSRGAPRSFFRDASQYATGRASGIPTVDTLFIVFAIRDGRVSGMHWHARRSEALEEAGVALPPA